MKLIRIPTTFRLMMIPFASFIILGISYWILGRNLALGIYPEAANDIGLPLFYASFMLFFVAILEFSAYVITLTMQNKTKIWRSLIILLISMLHLLVICLLLFSCLDWFKPNHMLMSYGYGIYALFVALCWISDI